MSRTSTPYTSDTEENTPTTSRTTGRPRTLIIYHDSNDDIVDDSDADPNLNSQPEGCRLFRRLKNIQLNRSHFSDTSEESDSEPENQINNPYQNTNAGQKMHKTIKKLMFLHLLPSLRT